MGGSAVASLGLHVIDVPWQNSRGPRSARACGYSRAKASSLQLHSHPSLYRGLGCGAARAIRERWRAGSDNRPSRELGTAQRTTIVALQRRHRDFELCHLLVDHQDDLLPRDCLLLNHTYEVGRRIAIEGGILGADVAP